MPQEVGKNFCLKVINPKNCLLWNNSDLPPIPFHRNVTLDFSISSGTFLRGGPSSSKVKGRMKTHTQSSYYSSPTSLIIWDMWGMKLVHSVLIVFCVLWHYVPVIRSHFPENASISFVIRCWFSKGCASFVESLQNRVVGQVFGRMCPGADPGFGQGGGPSFSGRKLPT